MTEEDKISEQNRQKEKLPSCCQPTKDDGKKKGILQGIAFGLIPHAGCVMFIVASILGLTVAASFFRPLLMKSYFFYGMIALSIVFASFSAFLYLRKQGGIKTAKNHKGYLAILYGSTIAISALLYFVIFPLVASASLAGASVGTNLEGLQTITLKVGIPCEGHATLISEGLKSIAGVQSVEYSPVSTFKVYYDAAKTDKSKILALDLFKEYKTTVLSENE